MQIYLAPMEGITTYIYRNAVHKYYGGFDRYFTPFLANRNLNYKDVNDVLPEHNAGMEVIPQILANQPDVFLEIAGRLEAYGYREVNLNLGCPSGTVAAKKRGAGFLSVPEQLDRFLEEIFDKCPLSISVKTRIGIEEWREWEPLLNIFVKYPMTELIIHPRFQKEYYGGKAHPEAFLQAEETFARHSANLCYNGDLVSEASMAELAEALQGKLPHAVMLGRGAIAEPGLQNRIRAFLKEPERKDVFSKKAETEEERDTFRKFHDELLERYIGIMSGDRPVLYKMKELWFHMGHAKSLSDKQMKQIKKANKISEYRAVISNILDAPVS